MTTLDSVSTPAVVGVRVPTAVSSVSHGPRGTDSVLPPRPTSLSRNTGSMLPVGTSGFRARPIPPAPTATRSGAPAS
jgi:hypothetical protein